MQHAYPRSLISTNVLLKSRRLAKGRKTLTLHDCHAHPAKPGVDNIIIACIRMESADRLSIKVYRTSMD